MPRARDHGIGAGKHGLSEKGDQRPAGIDQLRAMHQDQVAGAGAQPPQQPGRDGSGPLHVQEKRRSAAQAAIGQAPQAPPERAPTGAPVPEDQSYARSRFRKRGRIDVPIAADQYMRQPAARQVPGDTVGVCLQAAYFGWVIGGYKHDGDAAVFHLSHGILKSYYSAAGVNFTATVSIFRKIVLVLPKSAGKRPISPY